MPSIYERYDQIYKRLKKIDQEYISAEKMLEDFRFEDEVARRARIENLEQQLKDISVYYARVEYFRQFAEKNITSKNILSLKPLELDFNSLRQDARKIDPDNPNDPYAYRLYVHARCNEIYLELKEEEFTRKLEILNNGENAAYLKLEKQVNEVKRDLERDCARIIRSQEFNEFCTQLISFHHQYSRALYDLDSLLDRNGFMRKEQNISIGAFAQPLPLRGEEAKKAAEDRLVRIYPGDSSAGYQYYDRESQSILMPVEYDSREEVVLNIRTVTSKENRCFKGLNCLLLNMIRKTEPGNRKFKIYFLDALHLNNSQLKALRPLENSCVIAKAPQSEEEILETLRTIVSDFPNLDETLQDEDSVKDYNASVKERKDRIDRKLLVLPGYPGAYSAEAKKYISRILYNHERYGISVITIENLGYSDGSEDKDDKEKNKEKKKEKRESFSKNCFYIDMLQRQSSTIDRGDGEEFGFRWYEYDYKNQALPKNYIDSIRIDDEKELKESFEYTKVFSLDNWRYRSRSDEQRKVIRLPYGYNAKTKTYSEIDFSGEGFAAYLMGASGSGKSTLLHTLITGILRNYHPDDVELWLADFKMAEFSQYIDPLPPHIKYILLDESEELVFDLVDKLTDEMLKRQKFFMNSGTVKKVEQVPASVHMPVIFVILDEFSIMSQVLQDNDSYKLKLQNLLAKGRALGIKFIFSSQSYVMGIRGLTTTAKEQIQTRIAMKNIKDEIEGTLELPKYMKTEENVFMIETLPVHLALRKYRKNADELELERVNVLYFKGKDAEETYAPQRKLINDINSRYRAIEKKDYSETSENTYVDKQPVIVDGNSYEAFVESEYLEQMKRYRRDYADRLFDEDVLVSYGSPRRMERVIFQEISREARENILLIARGNEVACTASVVLSTMKAFTLQNNQVQIWAYEKNALYRRYKKQLALDKVEICEGIDSICDQIRALNKKIVAGEGGNKLIVLMGMDHICIDFDYIGDPAKESTESGSGKNIKQQYDSTQAKSDFQKIQGEIRKRFTKRVNELKPQWAAEGRTEQETKILKAQIKNEAEKEYLDEIHLPQSEFEKMRAESEGGNSAPGKETAAKQETAKQEAAAKDAAKDAAKNAEKKAAEEVPEKEPEGAYNAKADFTNVVKMGSRLGYHFLLVLNSFTDLKAMGLKLEYFRNRISFQISKDESFELLGKRNTGLSLPEHVCQYYNTISGYSFRPYLHVGVDWEGWSTDGIKAISPFGS